MATRSKNTIKQLQDLVVPTITMEQHQVQLKQALSVASRQNNNFKKQRWSNLMTKPKFIVSGATMAFAVLAILAFSILTNFGSVSAAELTEQSLNTLSRMSPDDLKALDTRINADPMAELKAAKEAKDLKIYTFEEFQKLDSENMHFAKQPGMAGALDDAPTQNAPENLKFLRFTDDDGATHTIGVNKDGLPVMVMVFKNNKDGSGAGSVMVQAGAMGTGVRGTAMMGPGPGMPAGATTMTSCSAGADGQPVCTNSDGSPAPAPTCTATTSGGMTCTSSASAQIKQ